MKVLCAVPDWLCPLCVFTQRGTLWEWVALCVEACKLMTRRCKSWFLHRKYNLIIFIEHVLVLISFKPSQVTLLSASYTLQLPVDCSCPCCASLPSRLSKQYKCSWFLQLVPLILRTDMLSIRFLAILELQTDDFYSKVVLSLHLSKVTAFSPLLPLT